MTRSGLLLNPISKINSEHESISLKFTAVSKWKNDLKPLTSHLEHCAPHLEGDVDHLDK